MAMAKFDVTAEFTFKGVFIVEAENRDEAAEKIEKHCGLIIGGDIHSTLPDDEIDWNFDVHPDKKIRRIKRQN